MTYRMGRWGRSTRITASDTHVRYYVANDGHGAPCLWADLHHGWQDCEECGYDGRFMWGPIVLLVKEDTEPVVWVATLRSLLNK